MNDKKPELQLSLLAQQIYSSIHNGFFDSTTLERYDSFDNQKMIDSDAFIALQKMALESPLYATTALVYCINLLAYHMNDVAKALNKDLHEWLVSNSVNMMLSQGLEEEKTIE